MRSGFARLRRVDGWFRSGRFAALLGTPWSRARELVGVRLSRLERLVSCPPRCHLICCQRCCYDRRNLAGHSGAGSRGALVPYNVPSILRFGVSATACCLLSRETTRFGTPLEGARPLPRGGFRRYGAFLATSRRPPGGRPCRPQPLFRGFHLIDAMSGLHGCGFGPFLCRLSATSRLASRFLISPVVADGNRCCFPLAQLLRHSGATFLLRD